VGTHKGYDGKDNIAWTLRFEDGKPNLADVDCFCVVCQLAFLYGTASWNKSNPFNEDCTVFRFTKGIRSEIPDTEFLWLLGQPQERHDVLPNRYEQDWVYRCRAGAAHDDSNQGQWSAEVLNQGVGRRSASMEDDVRFAGRPNNPNCVNQRGC
jgi:hypothetical protein